MFCYCQRYWKHAPDSVIRDAEKAWLKRNEKWLGDDATKSPRSVAALYCEQLPINPSLLDGQMDWDYFEAWPDDDDVADETEDKS